jgi:hypothetical protein
MLSAGCCLVLPPQPTQHGTRAGGRIKTLNAMTHMHTAMAYRAASIVRASATNNGVHVFVSLLQVMLHGPADDQHT